MSRLAAVAMVLLAAFTSCASQVGAIRPQWTVVLRTDAPVPDIGDRLLVEVTRPSGELANGASRRILNVSTPDVWPVSFGVAFTDEPLYVRARLYLARDTSAAGEPPEGIGIDARARLPNASGSAVVELGSACFGVPSSADGTCDSKTGEIVAIPFASAAEAPLPMLPGSYAPVAPCPQGPVASGVACISGGFFLLRESNVNTTVAQRGRAQLVRLTSFEVDQDEFSVGRYRALARANPGLSEPRLKANDRTLSSVCTYLGKLDDRADAQPLNCVTRQQARSYCEAEGARLIRSAEFTYVAGNRAVGTDFPWGGEADICHRAVVGRGPVGVELATNDGSFECRVVRPELQLGPLPIALAGAESDSALGVRALAGNLAEWTDDDFAVFTEPCWRARPYLSDPVCRTATRLPQRRGGSWLDPAATADARYRDDVRDVPSSAIGFRCARSLP
jgi:formylglycine-generating enzyme required for sulfatase activity